MTHPNLEHKNQTIEWAKGVINNPSQYAILDTETTGLGKKDVVIQIGIIDLNENVLMDTLIKPTSRKSISSDATAVHGISIDMLQDAPTFPEVYPKLKKIMNERNLIIYNASFDTNMIAQTSVLEKNTEDFKIEADCAMLVYSAYIGEWSEYHNNYKYQKLPAGDHTAVGDCFATLKIIREMASAEIVEIPKKRFRFRL